MIEDEKAGWRLTYRRIAPGWASYSGVKNGAIRYVRAIMVCDERAALFTMNYRQSEKEPYDPIVVRMPVSEGTRLLMRFWGGEQMRTTTV
ncbi:hypothetical protein [Mesorhizobium sp. M0239]|uniref:hypothetical protein n=1 Tax=Mesorhizobium sp. M0239 TaxID=2956924 RepID=UPI003334E5B4